MEQPLTIRWQSDANYFTAMLTPDLFGGWVVVTSSGARDGRVGRVRQKPVDSYEVGLDLIRKLRGRRRREGYNLSGCGFTEFERFDPRSVEMRSAETNALLRLFQEWHLDTATQAALLGVRDKALAGYLDGRPLDDDPALLARARDLLAIHKILRPRFDRRDEAIRAWLRAPADWLDGQTPLAAMLAPDGGLSRLRALLWRHADRLAGTAGRDH